MKTINIDSYKSSQINEEFASIQSLGIEDTAFDSGAFGEVYHCLQVNGNNIKTKQVIKIYYDDGNDFREKAHDTISKLQDKIISYFNAPGRKETLALQHINSLKALPQFSFCGSIHNVTVFGYAANLLDEHWLQFGKIFDEPDKTLRDKLRNQFYNLPASERLKMAFDLVEGFYHLDKMDFIHADLSPKNIFINIKESQLAIIDFETGGVNEEPQTIGTPGDWQAPEILAQMAHSNNAVVAGKQCDLWAVSIGVHFMLFHYHPLFYLATRGEAEMKDYFKDQYWPKADTSHPNFASRNKAVYISYTQSLNDMPPELRQIFSRQINEGYLNPEMRPDIGEWLETVGKLLPRPEVLTFCTTEQWIIHGNSANILWKTRNAISVSIDNGIGDVNHNGEITITANKNTPVYKLTAKGRYHATTAILNLPLLPLPLIESLKVPVPDFSATIHISIPLIKIPHISYIPIQYNWNKAIRCDKRARIAYKYNKQPIKRGFRMYRVLRNIKYALKKMMKNEQF